MPNEQGLSKRQMMREKRQREQMCTRIISIVAIVIGALVIVGLLIVPTLTPVGDFFTPAPLERPKVDFNAAGSSDAPITLTEYSDFQCPYCKRFSTETEKQLIDTYVASGKVRFVYRSFGLFVGPESQAAAEAAYCAGDQGKFWEYHDILFANQTAENVGDFNAKRLSAFANALGLNMSDFSSCVGNNKYKDRVTKDGIDGTAAGVQATPSFILTYTLNGQVQSSVIQGAQPFSAFQTAIEAALTALGQ